MAKESGLISQMLWTTCGGAVGPSVGANYIRTGL